MSVLYLEMGHSIGRLDYFLWGYGKSLVYANKPTTLEELRANIKRNVWPSHRNLNDRRVNNYQGIINGVNKVLWGHIKTSKDRLSNSVAVN